ncbi:MAG: hypothetical protein KY055_00365 [Candidatus Nealsonbacteria bacterium]|nr:hypothetical protein [Candidatus Nealsonbacteria bacterium]
MPELIATIILIGSFLGIISIAFKKISILAQLPEKPQKDKCFQTYFLKRKIILIKDRVKNWRYFKKVNPDIFFQNILSKIRVLSLKMENKTANLLQKIREKTKKKKIKEDDNYWQEIKNSTKNESE